MRSIKPIDCMIAAVLVASVGCWDRPTRAAGTPSDGAGLTTGSIVRPAPDAPTRRGLELVVYEQPNCGVCQAFRQRVAPHYLGQDTALKAPLRYVDIVASPVGQAGLRTNLTMLPTTVLMRDGAELVRLPGLVSAEAFVTIVESMLAQAGE